MADGKIQVIMDKDDLQPLADAIKQLKGITASSKLSLKELEEKVLESPVIETYQVNITSKTGAHPEYITYSYLDENNEIQLGYINNYSNKELNFILEKVVKDSWVIIGWTNETYGASVNATRAGDSTWAYKYRSSDILYISNTSSQHTGGSN